MNAFWQIYFIVGVIAATALVTIIGIPEGKKTFGAKVVLSLSLAVIWLLCLVAWPIALGVYVGTQRRG